MTLDRSTVNIDVRPGESLLLPGDVSVEFVHKSGRIARLRVTAPRDVRIQKKVDELGEVVPSVAESHRG